MTTTDRDVSAETPAAGAAARPEVVGARVFVATRPSEKRARDGNRAVATTDEAPTLKLPEAARANVSAETPRARKAAPRKPAAAWMFGGALGVFFGLLALLAFQVRAGADPALGPAQPAASAPAQRPVVIRRRIIRRVVVHHGASGQSLPAPAADEPAAPAPAAPPAPAPAPLTTQSS